MRKVDPERVERQRDEITAAAFRAFVKHGVQKSTTDDICREAGISPGRLYYYFPSKDAIIESVLLSFEDDFIAELTGLFTTADPIAAIREFARGAEARARFPYLTPAATWDLFAHAQRSPRLKAVVYESTGREIRTLREALERQKTDGRLRDGADIEILTSLIVALVSGIQAVEMVDPDYDLARYLRALETALRPWFVE